MHCGSTTIFLPRSWVRPLAGQHAYTTDGHGFIRDNVLLSRGDKIPAAAGTTSAAKSPGSRNSPALWNRRYHQDPPVPTRSFVDIAPVPEDISSISESFRGRWHAQGEGGRQQNALTLICPYVGRSQWRGTNPICRRLRLVTLRAVLHNVDAERERPPTHGAIRYVQLTRTESARKVFALQKSRYIYYRYYRHYIFYINSLKFHL